MPDNHPMGMRRPRIPKIEDLPFPLVRKHIADCRDGRCILCGLYIMNTIPDLPCLDSSLPLAEEINEGNSYS